jgi:hypothetical protein
MVTARFVVSRITPLGVPIKDGVPQDGEPWAYEVEMTPDYAQGRNEEWKAASPSGMFRLTIDPAKTEAVDQLKLGQHLEIRMVQIEDPLKA